MLKMLKEKGVVGCVRKIFSLDRRSVALSRFLFFFFFFLFLSLFFPLFSFLFFLFF